LFPQPDVPAHRCVERHGPNSTWVLKFFLSHDAVGNHYWPALYFADAQGRIRHHHFGQGESAQSEMVIQQLLAEAGPTGAGTEMVSVDPSGLEVPADWASLRSPENYTG
jgi:hypothetical protein